MVNILTEDLIICGLGFIKRLINLVSMDSHAKLAEPTWSLTCSYVSLGLTVNLAFHGVHLLFVEEHGFPRSPVRSVRSLRS